MEPSSADAQGKSTTTENRNPLASGSAHRCPSQNATLQAHAELSPRAATPPVSPIRFSLPLTSLRPILCPYRQTVVGRSGHSDGGWSARPRPA